MSAVVMMLRRVVSAAAAVLLVWSALTAVVFSLAAVNTAAERVLAQVVSVHSVAGPAAAAVHHRR